jgi:hypothetical protein
MSAIFIAELNLQVRATKSSNARRCSFRLYLGAALAYITRFDAGLGRFHTDGRVQSDKNAVERVIRPISRTARAAPSYHAYSAMIARVV